MAAYQPSPTSKTAGIDNSMGYVDIFVHQARDINNVCIYHKQDVYAKLSLTSNPDVSCSTRVINGGGRNPVFDEGLKLDVRTVEASLRCEVWMLSRMRNYLEDQLLGFALVPLSDSDILVADDGKLDQEFSMSSTDLLHTPAGFVRLSLSYVGSSPDVFQVSSLDKSASVVTDNGNDSLDPSEIEFPDLNMVSENETMVSKYLEMGTLEYSEDPIKAENCKLLQDDAAVPAAELSTHTINHEDSPETPDEGSCVSTTGSSAGLSITPQSVSEPSETTIAASSSETQREKSQGVTDGEADSSEAPPPRDDEVVQPAVISVNLQHGDSVVQQDIVDMYMKSMQQFTDSLAKMKLPFDVVENSSSPSADSTDSSTAEMKPSPGKGPRVFYGSRAFF